MGVRNGRVSKSLDAIVMKALSRDPADRYQTGDELARALGVELAAIAPAFDRARLGTLVEETRTAIIAITSRAAASPKVLAQLAAPNIVLKISSQVTAKPVLEPLPLTPKPVSSAPLAR